MATILSNATLVTGDHGRTILYDSALAVEDTVIAAIGPAHEVEAQFPGAEILDCRGKAVFPGLVNCHTHLLATADRESWRTSVFLRRSVFPNPPGLC